MKRKKWIIIALVLCMTFLFPAVVSAAAKEQGSAQKDSVITRIEWLHKLSEKFNKSENFEDIVIHDMEEKDEFYQDAVWAVGKGLVSLDKEGNLNPDETVSKGFSAYTLSLCLDIQTKESTTEADVSSIPEDAKYYAYDVIAVSRGWFVLDGETFDDSRPVTEEEVSRMLEDAGEILSIQETVTDGSQSYDFQDGVIEVPAEDEVSISEDGENTEVTIQDSDTEIEKGDTFIVYQDSLPIAYEAQEVEQQGNDSVVSASRADDDAYGDLNEQGTLQLHAGNAEFTPAENVEVLTDTFSANSARSGGPNLEYKDGKLVVEISEGDASIKVTLSNLGVRYSVTSNGTMLSLTGNWAVLSELAMKDTLIDHTLGTIRIYGVGVIKLQFNAKMSLDTKASCSGTFEAGVSTLSDGTVRGIHEFTALNSSSVEIKEEIELSLRISAGLDVLVMHGLVYSEIGMTTEASRMYHNLENDGSKETIVCDDIQEYFTLKVGYDVKVFEMTLLSDSASIIDGDSKNNPILFRVHFENGVKVSECRFGMTITQPDFGSKFTGGVDASEIDWSKRKLEVEVTLYNNLELDGSLTIVENGGINLNGYTLKINGDLIQEGGKISLGGGKLEVGGDYRIQKYDAEKKMYGDSTGILRMQAENDEVTVGGDFYMQSSIDTSESYDGFNRFAAGKLTLKGNFTQLNGHMSNFVATGTKVIFAGSGMQEISFESPKSSYFRYPVFQNQNVRIKGGIYSWMLTGDAVLKNEGYPLEILGYIDLNGKVLKIEGDVYMKGEISVNGGSCEITGNLIQESGEMSLGGGKLEVGGDYRIQKYDAEKKMYGDSTGILRMQAENDEVTVGGDFYMQSSIDTSESYDGFNRFAAGKLTLKGNFTQLNGHSSNFRATETKVIFAGSGMQEVSFESPKSSYFHYPVFQNQNVRIKGGIYNWMLTGDAVLKNEGYPLEILGYIDLNGKVLKIEGDVYMKGEISVNGGSCEITGNLTQEDGTMNLSGGSCEITGNLIQESGEMSLGGGKLEVGGDYRIQKYDAEKKMYGDSTGILRMWAENDEVTVGGDFYMQSSATAYYYYSCFADGKLTLKGNFTQLKGSEYNFQATGTKVIFAGTGIQEVYFETPSSSYISNPVYQNTKVCYMGKRKIALSGDNAVLTVTLPGNNEVVSEGLIYSEDENPTIDTQGRTRIAFTGTSNDEGTFDASGLEGNTFRAYVIIKDVGGTDRVFYSDPVKIAG